jgi:hypothetical protein
MKQKGVFFGLFLFCFISAANASSEYKVVNGTGDFYYGHISYAEIKNDGKDPVVFREGRLAPELAVLNLPLGPGDVIQTSDVRRSEIQFDNGTIVRLDLNSKVTIETILAPSLSTAKKLSNLLLGQGQVYVMYKKYNSQEIFQIITPRAAVKMDHNSVALIQLTKDGDTDVQAERGKVQALYGSDKLGLHRQRINPKERYVVSGDDQVRPAEYTLLSDFKAWNESVNANFIELHEGSYLPKPIQNLPEAVFYFAQNFGDSSGEWLWHDLYGYVWRPYLNDQRYPGGTWQPYIWGNWAEYDGRLFWVPGEPWGWVPYHLGIWMWDKNRGWLWLPGSMFAPAWVTWDFYFGNLCWRPWQMFDWMYGFPYDGVGFYGLWSDFYGNYPMSYYTPGPNHPQEIRRTIRKDQLKRKDSPSLPLPKEMKKALEATVLALKRGDQDLRATLEAIPRHSVIVRKEDFAAGRWQDKVIPFDRFIQDRAARPQAERISPPRRPDEAAREALRTIQRNQALAETRARLVTPARVQREPGPVAQPELMRLRTVPLPGAERVRTGVRIGEPAAEAAPSQPSFRFRDWNPDVRTAIRLGVEISYLSRTNEVACPQLGVYSRHLLRGNRLSEQGIGAYSPVGSNGTYSSGNQPASTSTATHSTGSSHTQGSSSGATKEKN